MEATKATFKYLLVDTKTGITLATYEGDAGRKRAYRRADKLDLAYGAVRYVVRFA